MFYCCEEVLDLAVFSFLLFQLLVLLVSFLPSFVDGKVASYGYYLEGLVKAFCISVGRFVK